MNGQVLRIKTNVILLDTKCFINGLLYLQTNGLHNKNRGDIYRYVHILKLNILAGLPLQSRLGKYYGTINNIQK